MFNPLKNSYLQLECAINPRVINKAVEKAMKGLDPERVPCSTFESLVSAQPCLFAPHVDITRARMGFERVGLRILIRELNSPDALTQLQAIHSLLDEVKITENAIFLIENRIVDRLIDLMYYRNPVIREKVCLILNTLATYEKGKNRILIRPQILDSLMWLTLKDKKEIRFAAATALNTISGEGCAPEVMVKNGKMVKALLDAAVSDHIGIVLLHLKTLERLIEWSQVKPLEHNAFQVMIALTTHEDPRIVCGAFDCLTALLAHDVARELADKEDLVFYLRPYLRSDNQDVIIAASSVLRFATITTRSKWRAKEICPELCSILVPLCHSPLKPMLQMNCLQVLLNLCDSGEFRKHLTAHYLASIKSIFVGAPADLGEVLCTNDGDIAAEINCYIKHVYELKELLLNAMNWKPYKEAVTLY